MRELSVQRSLDSVLPFRQRFTSLRQLDGGPRDRDSRPGFLETPDGLQAMLGGTPDAFQYTARWCKDGVLLRGESATVKLAEEKTQLLASTYEGDGQPWRDDGPAVIRWPASQPGGGELPRLLQWNFAGQAQDGNQTRVTESTGAEARPEEYYYGHSFDLSWQP